MFDNHIILSSIAIFMISDPRRRALKAALKPRLLRFASSRLTSAVTAPCPASKAARAESVRQ